MNDHNADIIAQVKRVIVTRMAVRPPDALIDTLLAPFARASGDLSQNPHLRGLMTELRGRPPESLREDEVRALVAKYAAPLLSDFAPDAATGDILREAVEAASLPGMDDPSQREATMRRLATEMIFNRVQMPPEVAHMTARLQSDYAASGLEPGKNRRAHRTFFSDFVGRALPLTPPADQERIADTLTDTFAPQQRGIPAGCLVLGALAGGLIVAYAVVGLLLLNSEALAESQVGQSLIATTITMSIGIGIFAFVRRRMQHPLGLLQLAAIAVITGAILFIAFNSGTLDVSQAALETAEGREQGASMLLFALLTAGAAVLYVRRLVSGLLWLAVLVVLLGGAAFFAVQAGLIDLDAFRQTFDTLQNTQ